MPHIAKTRAALYARVSTTEQRVDLQLREMRDYAAGRGWETTEYIDHGVSGSETRRPRLAALTEDLHRHSIEVVLVWKFDRMFRSVQHILEFLAMLKNLHVDFVSVTDHVETSTPAGKMHFTMIAAFAEFERSLTRERQMAGIAAARERGVKFGAPAKSIDEKRIREDHDLLRSYSKVARIHGVSKTTIIRVCHERRLDRRKFPRELASV
jgi:DNA invertase Pin-like site-specific DNA recombinase